MNNNEDIKRQVKKHDQMIKINTINKCKEAIKEYFKEYIDRIPDELNNMDFIDTYILIPNQELSRKLELMKGAD